MHLHTKSTGTAARSLASSPPPFGPGFRDEVVARVEAVEVWASGFGDPGDDFCEFRALDAAGKEIARTRIGGY